MAEPAPVTSEPELGAGPHEDHDSKEGEKHCWCNILHWSRGSQIKLAVFLVLVATIVVLVVVFHIQDRFLDLLQWLRNNRTEGAFAFVGIYAVCTVFLVPGALLTLGAGFVFGILVGLLVVVVGAGIGLNLAFLLGRYVFRDAVARKVSEYPKFAAVDAAVEKEGWKIVFLLRLAPIVPFTAFNYAMSVTKVQFLHYAIPSCIGIIPGTAMFCYFGSLASDLSTISSEGPDRTTQWIIIAVSGVLIIAAVVVITRMARRAINNALTNNPSLEKPLLDADHGLVERTASGSVAKGTAQNGQQTAINYGATPAATS